MQTLVTKNGIIYHTIIIASVWLFEIASPFCGIDLLHVFGKPHSGLYSLHNKIYFIPALPLILSVMCTGGDGGGGGTGFLKNSLRLIVTVKRNKGYFKLLEGVLYIFPLILQSSAFFLLILGWESKGCPDLTLCCRHKHSSSNLPRDPFACCHWWVLHLCHADNLYHLSRSL